MQQQALGAYQKALGVKLFRAGAPPAGTLPAETSRFCSLIARVSHNNTTLSSPISHQKHPDMSTGASEGNHDVLLQELGLDFCVCGELEYRKWQAYTRHTHTSGTKHYKAMEYHS
jgi:hypothetical protein